MLLPCDTCDGEGEVARYDRSGTYPVSGPHTCQDCGGEGEREWCDECGGDDGEHEAVCPVAVAA